MNIFASKLIVYSVVLKFLIASEYRLLYGECIPYVISELIYAIFVLERYKNKHQQAVGQTLDHDQFPRPQHQSLQILLHIHRCVLLIPLERPF